MATETATLILAFVALAIAVIALTIAARTAVTSAHARATTAGPAIARRLDELEATTTELSADLRRIRSRYTMQERRAKASGQRDLEDEPDWREDPQGWRAYWDRKISQRRSH